MKRYLSLIIFHAAILIVSFASAQNAVEKWETLYNKGVALSKANNFQDAFPMFEEALNLARHSTDRNSLEYANLLFNIGTMYFTYENNIKAEPLFLEAKEIYLNVSGKEDLYYVASLSYIGRIYSAMGRYSEAEPVYQEAMKTYSKVFGKEHPYYAISISNLSELYTYTGNYAKAEPLFLEANEIYAKVFGKEHPYYVTSAINLGTFYGKIGNYSKAEPLMLESKEIVEKILGKRHPSYVSCLINLGQLYSEMDSYAKAESLFLESKEIIVTEMGKENHNYLTVANNLGLLYRLNGRYPQAEPLMLEAKAIGEKLLGKQHPDYGIYVGNLGKLYLDMKKYASAEPLLIEAKETHSRVFGKKHNEYVTSAVNLAELYIKTGNYSQAEFLYQEAILAVKDQLFHYFPSLSEVEKQKYCQSLEIIFSFYERFCVVYCKINPNIISELYNLKLVTKGLLFNTSDKIRKNILSSGNQYLIDLFTQWKSKKDFIAKVYQMSLVEKSNKNIDEKKLEEDVNRIEKEISLKSEEFSRSANNKQYRWEDVRESLNVGEVAIELLRTQKKTDNQYHNIYVALIVTSQTQNHPDIVVIENGDELEGKFSKYYRNAIMQKVKDTISYNQFWKPIADRIAGSTRVYFSADGAYNQINLNTLFNPVTGKYVLDEIEAQVVTSSKDLITRSEISKKKIVDVTLFGYPNYNNFQEAKVDDSRLFANSAFDKSDEIKADSTQRFLNGDNIAELPGTKLEVETIEFLLKKDGIAIHKFMFDQATETAIKKLNSPQVLHIATHGFFMSDLQIPNESGQGFAGMETKKLVENPLLRSGLLFAGVKKTFSKSVNNSSMDVTTEDGLLTAYEAMNLSLDKTDLVVMSACETGLGVISNGEGVYGLQRAFQVAGAKSILMSLWTVSDEATQQLMTKFYENWLGGKSSREAFRDAQLLLRTKYSDPYFWGAFVMVGN